MRSHAEFDELFDDANATIDTLKRYIADVVAFAGDASQADDITMLCLSWEGKR